jgi:hypothetical protein
VGRDLAQLLGPAQGDDPVGPSLADGVTRTRRCATPTCPACARHHLAARRRRGRAQRGGDLQGRERQREQQERLLQASRLADVGQLAAGVGARDQHAARLDRARAEALLRYADDPGLTAQPAFEKFPRYLRAIAEEIFRCKKIIGRCLDIQPQPSPGGALTDLNALCENAATCSATR